MVRTTQANQLSLTHTSPTESREGTWPKIGASRNPRVARVYRRDCRQCLGEPPSLLTDADSNFNSAEKLGDSRSSCIPNWWDLQSITFNRLSLRSQTSMLSKLLLRLKRCEGGEAKWRTKGKLVRQEEQLRNSLEPHINSRQICFSSILKLT